jgi:hypothetical protein
MRNQHRGTPADRGIAAAKADDVARAEGPEAAPIKGVFTHEDVFEAVRQTGDMRRIDDPRVRVLFSIAREMEQFQNKLDWMARDLAREVDTLRQRGVLAVSSCVGNSSLWNDVPVHAARIEVLRGVATELRVEHDAENQDVVDRFITFHLNAL